MNIMKFIGISSKLSCPKAVKSLYGTNFQRTIGFFTIDKDATIRRDIGNMRFDSISGMPGSGAGKGGGAGGSVKESGGRLGEYGAAQEEHYFFNKQKEQLKNIKKKLETDKPGETSQKEEK